MNIKWLRTDQLIPYARNPRINDAAVDAVAASIKEFGWQQPIVIDQKNVVVAGHTRLKAAQKLGLESVPCLIADELSDAQIKAYRILDNKVAEISKWDFELLKLELDELPEFNFEAFDVEFPFMETTVKNSNTEIDTGDYKETMTLFIELSSEDYSEAKAFLESIHEDAGVALMSLIKTQSE